MTPTVLKTQLAVEGGNECEEKEFFVSMVQGLFWGGTRPIRRSAPTFVYSTLISTDRIRGRRLAPLQSSPIDDLHALVTGATETERSELEIQDMVDAFCTEHGATMDMLKIMKGLGEKADDRGDCKASETIEVIAARVTQHLLGLSGARDDDGSTSLVSQQQRMARDLAVTSELEAAMIARKAESMLQLIGRKAISPEDLHVRIPDRSDAVRILEVLLSVENPKHRHEMLVDAFDSGEYEENAENEEEEGLWTTPMVLYQAIEERLSSTAGDSEADILRDLKDKILKDHLA